jgi:hypothetical protein
VRPVWVDGTALWTTGYGSVDAWLANRREPSVTSPRAALANPRLLRGTSVLTRLQVEVGEQVVRAAGFDDPSNVPMVFGSAHGEIGIALLQLDMMRDGDGIVSPARFKNSVHNTGSGIFSIATGARGFTTAIAGGDQTVALALLEAWALVVTAEDRAVVVVADEPLPPPLNERADYEPLAIGFAISRTPGDDCLAQLSGLRCSPAAGTLDLALPPELEHNPTAVGVPLLRAVHEVETDCVVPLSRGSDRWTVRVGPA